MDGDTIYVTNHPEIVLHAKYCQTQYPTIVNNIPKDTTQYKNTSLDLSYIDNKLMSSQMGIGLTSNLAQVALSYSYTFPEQKYKDYVCILSVLAQVYIDSSKRAYDIDLNEETKRIQRDLNIRNNGYPVFLKPIHKFNNKRIGMGNVNVKGEHYNSSIKCPMNHLYNTDLNPRIENTETIPMKEFFVKFSQEPPPRMSRKVEQMIEKYSFRLYKNTQITEEDSYDNYLVQLLNFEELIKDIRQLKISKKYKSLISYLIDRAFLITPCIQSNKEIIASKMRNNRPVLLKVLYTLSPECFLSVFVKK